MLWKLRAQGFRVLLAHPERNATLQGDPARLRRLVDQGVLVQVTAEALALPPEPLNVSASCSCKRHCVLSSSSTRPKAASAPTGRRSQIGSSCCLSAYWNSSCK
jgi:hypothetical protein